MFTYDQRPFVPFLASLAAFMVTALFLMSAYVPVTGVVTCATFVSLDGRAVTAQCPHVVWAVS
jgi:hypothetical protein